MTADDPAPPRPPKPTPAWCSGTTLRLHGYTSDGRPVSGPPLPCDGVGRKCAGAGKVWHLTDGRWLCQGCLERAHLRGEHPRVADPTPAHGPSSEAWDPLGLGRGRA